MIRVKLAFTSSMRIALSLSPDILLIGAGPRYSDHAGGSDFPKSMALTSLPPFFLSLVDVPSVSSLLRLEVCVNRPSSAKAVVSSFIGEDSSE